MLSRKLKQVVDNRVDFLKAITTINLNMNMLKSAEFNDL